MADAVDDKPAVIVVVQNPAPGPSAKFRCEIFGEQLFGFENMAVGVDGDPVVGHGAHSAFLSSLREKLHPCSVRIQAIRPVNALVGRKLS